MPHFCEVLSTSWDSGVLFTKHEITACLLSSHTKNERTSGEKVPSPTLPCYSVTWLDSMVRQWKQNTQTNGVPHTQKMCVIMTHSHFWKRQIALVCLYVESRAEKLPFACLFHSASAHLPSWFSKWEFGSYKSPLSWSTPFPAMEAGTEVLIHRLGEHIENPQAGGN